MKGPAPPGGAPASRPGSQPGGPTRSFGSCFSGGLMPPRVLQDTVERGGSEPRCPLRWEGLLGHNHSPSARYVSAHLAGVLAVNCTGAERRRATL